MHRPLRRTLGFLMTALILVSAPASADERSLKLGQAALRDGHPTQAVEHFQQAVQRFTATAGERAGLTLEARAGLVQALGAAGQAEEQLVEARALSSAAAAVYGEGGDLTLAGLVGECAALETLGRPAEWLPVARRLAQLAQGRGDRDPRRVSSLLVRSRAERESGLYRDQLASAEEAWQLATAAFGERHPASLSALKHLVDAQGEMGRYADQLRSAERAARLHAEVLGPRHVATFTSQTNLIWALRNAGRVSEGLALAERVLRERVEALGAEHPHVAASYLELAVAQGTLGRYLDAERSATEAWRIRRRHLGERHPQTLLARRAMAGLLLLLGRLSEAQAMAEEAQRWAREALGAAHPIGVSMLQLRSQIHSAAGRQVEALRLAEEALARQRALQGERHPSTWSAMDALAQASGAVGRLDEQILWNERAARLREDQLGPDHPRTQGSYSNVAYAYLAADRARDALVPAAQAAAQLERQLGPDSQSALAALTNLARAQQGAGQHEEGLATIRRVLERRSAILGELNPHTLNARHYLAEFLGAQGRFAEQRDVIAVTAERRAEQLGEGHPATLRSVALWAQALDGTGEGERAAGLAERYLRGVEALRAQPGLSAADRRGLFGSLADEVRRFSWRKGRGGDVAEAFRIAEASKARTLLESLAEQRAGRSGVLQGPDQERWSDLSTQLATLERQWAETADDAARRQLRRLVDERSRELAALRADLVRRYPKFAQLVEFRPVGLADAVSTLPAETVALSFVVAGDAVQVFVIERGRPARWIDLGTVRGLADAAEIVRLGSSRPGGLDQVRREGDGTAFRLADGSWRLVRSGEAAPANVAEALDAGAVAAWLADRLFAPVADVLARHPRWLIAPDGPLAVLPFEVLPFRGRPAVESALVHYTQSLSVHALTRERAAQVRQRSFERELLAMGDPAYAASAGPTRAARRALLESGPGALRELSGQWPALPGTRREVVGLAQLFGERAEVHLGQAASEQTLLALNASGRLGRFRYLHLATHGYLSAAEPALSSVVLSQTDLPPGVDGYVTAAEWPSFDLQSELVVLSACETGLGRLDRGEGVLGLSFAIFVAGSSASLLSLWPAFDDATAAFMLSLYRRLTAGELPAEALARTKREFLRHPRWSHPAFWAPFVLVGAG